MLFVLKTPLTKAQGFDEFNYRSEFKMFPNLGPDSLWLYHTGDNAHWADTAIDEQGWEVVNTEYLKNSSSNAVLWNGIGWFRKRFAIKQNLQGQPLALRMAHFGASEIYLDGKLIYRFGKVGGTISDEQIYVPRQFVIIQPTIQSSAHLLAVRYSNQHAKLSGYTAKFIGFRLFLIPANTALGFYKRDLTFMSVIASVTIAFSVFFLLVYFFYPKRLASLLTALLLANFSCIFITIYIIESNNEWNPILWGARLGSTVNFWTPCFTLVVLYALYYNGKLPRRMWIAGAAMLLYLLYSFSVLSRIESLIYISNALIYTEIIRMFWLGIKHKKTGFGILVTGWTIAMLGVLLFVLDIFNWFPESSITLSILRTVFAALIVPLTYALHLAWEFRSANKELRLQLKQVQGLSEKTLRQEKEKQQILSSQKEMLEQQVAERTAELKQSLENLKSTQAQLIQSEKMASLGELTAGIAHEIQNPLNFVNNFSDVNQELLVELKDEADKGNIDDVKAIADDVINNEQKINHHGKRADAIVKGMLQHSRASTGTKEPTDINALADEYLRLSYHGMRAKDKTFNASLRTDFDTTIGKLNVVPQDIGRVLINLFNNSFYAVSEKKKIMGNGYDPIVSVSTKKVDSKAEIRVKDNGNGIPPKIVDKIFQPFFTTKPTGQGTGLGLSLSYDIIKAHGGMIRVETREGEGSEFVLQLPTKS